jgi:hypothetical protein
MADNNTDRIFQLSLTEVAFILVFLLLLLLGKLLMNERDKNVQLQTKYVLVETELNNFKNVSNYDELLKRYQSLKKNIESYLVQAAVPDHQRILDDLVSVAKLDKEISDLKDKLEKAQSKSQVCEALIQKGGEINTENYIKLSEDKLKIDNMLDKLRSKGVKVKDLSELSDQFFRNIDEVVDLRSKCGGGQIGPCWRDESGQTMNILNITLENNNLSVTIPKLPEKRLIELNSYPNSDLATRSVIPYSEMDKSFGPILKWSKEQSPECRHYVSIKSNIPLTKDSTPKRLQVQQYFYPDESAK